MAKKKKSPKVAISDREILAMYEDVLPLIYSKTPARSPSSQINQCLKRIIKYDFLHYIMEDPFDNGATDRLRVQYIKWGGTMVEQNDNPLALIPNTGIEFESLIEENYNTAILRDQKLNPDNLEYHYHRIESRGMPRIVVGFFRAKLKSDNAFTREELGKFKQLRPHILRLYRLALTVVVFKKNFQVFNTFAAVGSRIANEHGLSEAEVRLIPDILFGNPNEVIADKHFISLATVKTHINHILKKTGTKNRVDFMSKFFTSPENTQL